MEMIFNKKPARTISFISNCPDPKMMALGAVATGIINAHEAAIVIPVISPNGWTLMVIDNAAKTGIISVQVAIFWVNSVK